MNHQHEMSVVVNPSNPLEVVGFTATSEPGDPGGMVEMFRSTDGGQNWAPTHINSAIDGLPDFTDTDNDNMRDAGEPLTLRADPTLTFDAAGNLYLVYMYRLNDASNRDLRVITWLKGAAGFTNQGIIIDSGIDKPIIASGPGGVNAQNQPIHAAYVAYVKGQSSIVVAGSLDLGATWTLSGNIRDGVTGSSRMPHPAVGSDGSVYVSWHQHNSFTTTSGLILIDRDDSGLQDGFTFGQDVVVRSLSKDVFVNEAPSKVPATPSRGFGNSPTIAVDRSGGDYHGRIYMAFVDNDSGSNNNDFDTFLTVSDDGGSNWFDPSDPSDTVTRWRKIEDVDSTQFNAWVAVDQTSGMVGITYYSTQLDMDPNDDADPVKAAYNEVSYRIATSADGGNSFAFDWLSGTTATSNEAKEPPSAPENRRDYLEYNGLFLHGGTAHGLWAFRGTDAQGNRTYDLEAFTARASFNSSTSSNVLTVTGDDSGSATNDTIELRLSAANGAYLEVFVNTVLQYAGLLATIDSVNIDSRAGNDTVFFNFANGNLLAGLVSVSLVGGTGTDVAKAAADQDMTLTNTLLSIGALGSITLTSGIETATLTGGISANTISAAAFSNGPVTLTGGAGNDTLTGGAGNDTINGGTGDDTMLTGTAADGADIFNGNAGVDTADYSGRTANLSVSVDNAANDGQTDTDPIAPDNQSEADNIKSDVERVVGGTGNDNLSGLVTGVTLRGGAGNDTLTGSSGNDSLYGELNNDMLIGGYGGDYLEGNEGKDSLFGDFTWFNSAAYGDTLDGGSGDDVCYGGSGDDSLVGGLGADVLHGEDGDDRLKAGTQNSASDGATDILYGGNGIDTSLLSESDRDAGDSIPLNDIENL